MSHRPTRPPLAEIDTWELWLALRAGRIRFVMPWLFLLAGFCAVTAGMACFFWLTARNDPVAMVGLGLVLIWFCWFLWQRLSTRPGFALALLLAMFTLSLIIFGIWLLVYNLNGENVWVGILGVTLVCTLGIILGMLGIRGVTPTKTG